MKRLLLLGSGVTSNGGVSAIGRGIAAVRVKIGVMVHIVIVILLFVFLLLDLGLFLLLVDLVIEEKFLHGRVFTASVGNEPISLGMIRSR